MRRTSDAPPPPTPPAAGGGDLAEVRRQVVPKDERGPRGLGHQADGDGGANAARSALMVGSLGGCSTSAVLSRRRAAAKQSRGRQPRADYTSDDPYATVARSAEPLDGERATARAAARPDGTTTN